MTDDIYAYLDQSFEWDQMKAARNAIKHGVRFPEAATVFFDASAIFERDSDHSIEEERYIVVGCSIRRKVILVVHVLRGDKIRILSARIATPRERRHYDESRGGI
ncbi:BrnT family toxin [soil metagenome]